ncbi:hypothetical protein K439DRAFT_1410435 [Ramaria rubella]|nr:hypothetical protein K439DRAFT_1410435 [Ramaria rubella]
MEDNLVSRRSKRSTAGNRMEAALAEMSVEDLMQDVEEDVDFVSKADEEDMFESDFASTDEDGDDEDAGEKALEEEEKRAKRAARQKPFKVPKIPARKVTFDSPAPEGEDGGSSTPKGKSKPQRRVSLGQATDAETGEVLEVNKRQSSREATRLNTQELQSRLKTAEGRRALLTKRPKEVERRKTQAELIAAALDMEEENIISHRDYLVTEEERRKKARVVKPETIGPKIRWRSRIEDVSVSVYDPIPQSYQTQRPSWISPFAQNSNSTAHPGVPYHNPYISSPMQAPSGSTTPQIPGHPYTPSNPRAVPSNPPASTSKQTPATPTTVPPYTNPYYQYSYYNVQSQPSHSPYQPYGPYYTYQPPGQYGSTQSPRPHLQLHPQAQVTRKTTEKQTKNYVEILLDEERPQEKPKWRETMDALFGDHADWDNVRVYVGKNRPVARQIQTCPITGLQARYRDPRSGVPYANAGAFRILSRLLAHEYVWSPAPAPSGVGVFVGHEKQRGAVGVPDSWGEAMAGVEEGWRKKRVEGRKEEKTKEKEKEKEIRVGERRSSRIAGDGGESTVAGPGSMDVDKTAENELPISSGNE